MGESSASSTVVSRWLRALWKELKKSGGFKYLDKVGSHGGIAKTILKPGKPRRLR